MANVDDPRGYVPIRNLNGDTYFSANPYYMTASETIYAGDLVQMVTAGTVEVAAAANPVNLGVAAETITSGANTTTKVMIYDDPNTIFMGQTVSGTDFTLAMVGSITIPEVLAGAFELDIATVETAIATKAQMKIIRLVERQDNALGEHADVEFILCNHQWSNNAAGI